MSNIYEIMNRIDDTKSLEENFSETANQKRYNDILNKVFDGNDCRQMFSELIDSVITRYMLLINKSNVSEFIDYCELMLKELKKGKVENVVNVLTLLESIIKKYCSKTHLKDDHEYFSGKYNQLSDKNTINAKLYITPFMCKDGVMYLSRIIKHINKEYHFA